MNLHRLACRLGHHVWSDDQPDEQSWCISCGEPHPTNVDGICEKHGHTWGQWQPTPIRMVDGDTLAVTSTATVQRDDISDLLLHQLTVRTHEMFGKLIVDKEPTEWRRCHCCKRIEDNGVRHSEGGFFNTIVREEIPAHMSIQWVEDNLTEPPA